MNQQEIFDRVTSHLAKQKKPSGMVGADPEDPESFGCMYRGPDNCKCAFGVLISDEAYHPRMENVSALGIIGAAHNPVRSEDGSYELPFMSEKLIEEMGPLYLHRALIQALQQCHDKLEVGDWGVRLARIASAYGLSFDKEAFEKELNEK
jgi:hypothetical protein